MNETIYEPLIHEVIPFEITQKALEIEVWAKKNGWKHWCLHGIADRNLVEELRHRLSKYEPETDRQPDSY